MDVGWGGCDDRGDEFGAVGLSSFQSSLGRVLVFFLSSLALLPLSLARFSRSLSPASLSHYYTLSLSLAYSLTPLRCTSWFFSPSIA